MKYKTNTQHTGRELKLCTFYTVKYTNFLKLRLKGQSDLIAFLAKNNNYFPKPTRASSINSSSVIQDGEAECGLGLIKGLGAGDLTI